MTTASNAKIRRTGPSNGPKVVRMPEEDAGDRDRAERDRGRDRVDVAVVDAGQPRRIAVVGRGPQRSAELGPADAGAAARRA